MRIDYTVALTSAISEDGWYGIQPQGHGGPNAGLGYADLQSPFGFTSRPLDADIDSDGVPSGCFLWKADSGNSAEYAWLGTDPRHVAKCPPVTKGSSAQWSAKGAFHLLDHDADTSTLYVPVEFDDNGSPTKAHTIVVGKDANGGKYIELRHSNGAYLVINDTSTVMRHVGNALIEVLNDAINLNGKVNTTASMNVGGAAAQPVVNATALATQIGIIVAPMLSSPGTPVTNGMLAAALGAIATALGTTAATQMLKGL